MDNKSMNLSSAVVPGAMLLVVALMASWWLGTGSDDLEASQAEDTGRSETRVSAKQLDATATQPPADPSRTSVRIPSDPRPAAPEGRVRVLVNTKASDGSDSPLVGFLVHVLANRHRDEAWRGIEIETNPDGVAECRSLANGKYRVYAGYDLSDSARFAIVDGGVTSVTLQIKQSLVVRGLVQDDAGNPVAGATIEVMKMGFEAFPRLAATSSSEGQFSIAHAPIVGFVVATKAGYETQPATTVVGAHGSEQTVKIRLSGGGGGIEGLVTGTLGNAVRGAVVQVGGGERDFGSLAANHAVRARADSQGAFTMVGLKPKVYPIKIVSSEFAPWESSCEVFEHSNVQVRATLSPAGSCRGQAQLADGSPAARVRIRHDSQHPFLQRQVRTDAAGRYELRGLPLERVTLTAESIRYGFISEEVWIRPSEESRWDPKFRASASLEGRVITEVTGREIQASVVVMSRTEEHGGRAWMRQLQTNRAGEFRVDDVPADALLDVAVHTDSGKTAQVTGFKVGGEILTIRVPEPGNPVGKVFGRVVGLDATALRQVAVSVRGGVSGLVVRDPEPTDRSGWFDVGGLVIGKYRVTVACPGWETLLMDVDLAAKSGWDLGEIQLKQTQR